MSAAKHTPGPWKDGPVFQKEGRAIFITDATKLGKWQRRLDDKTGAFSPDDARLIAAAPQLLEAAQLLLRGYGVSFQDEALRTLLRDAVSAATGGQS